MLKRIIISTLIILCTGCTNYVINNKDVPDNNIYLIIDKLDINKELNISSIKEDVNGIVMFYEYGRPNISNSNTIIGAHSGYGSNAYFNDLSNIDIKDIIKIKYKEILYTYEVNDVFEVYDTDLSILENKNESIITLLTCKMSELNKRIVVIGVLSEIDKS